MGDAHIAAESLIYTFGTAMRPLYAKFLRDIADTQRVTNAACGRNMPVSAIAPAPPVFEQCLSSVLRAKMVRASDHTAARGAVALGAGR